MKLLSLPLVAVVFGLAACGGSGGGNPDADPAAIVPARAPVYVEAVLNPEGELADDVRALSQKLAGTDDPGAEIVKLIETEARKNRPDFSWKDDVEPWLGDRGAIALLDISQGGGSGKGGTSAAAVVAVKDADKAQEFVDEQVNRKGAKIVDRTQGDVEYKLDAEEDTAAAIVEDYAVIGNEAAVKAIIDAADGGESLADADRFKQARDQVADDGLGFAYVGVSSLISRLGPQGAAVRPLLGFLGESVAVSLDVDPNAIRFDSASIGVSGPPSAGPGKVFGELPGSSWLALGVADVGGSVSRAIRQFGQLGALGGVDIEREIRRGFGIDIQRDIASWMGDAGVFATGGSLAELSGGLVVEVTDQSRARAAIPKLVRLMRRFGLTVSRVEVPGGDVGYRLRSAQLPIPVGMALIDDRFVIAAGAQGFSLATAQSGEQLADNPEYKEAAKLLGDGIDPQVYVNIASIRELAGSLGLAQQGEAGRRAQRALEALTAVIAGGRRDGDIARGRLVVGVE